MSDPEKYTFGEPGGSQNEPVAFLRTLIDKGVPAITLARSLGIKPSDYEKWSAGASGIDEETLTRLEDLRAVANFAFCREEFINDPGLFKIFLIARMPDEAIDLDENKDFDLQTLPPTQADLIAAGKIEKVISNFEEFSDVFRIK